VPLNVVANRFSFEPFNRLTEELRSAGHGKVIYLNENPREIIRALRRSEIVAILPDLDIRRIPGTFVTFFGRPAWTPIGPVLTGKVSGAPLVPYFMVREGAKYRVLIGDPIRLSFEGDRRLDAYRNTQRWSDVYEAYIRRYPDQWAWNHLRWNTRPSDVPEAFRQQAVFPSEVKPREQEA
jgi:KDO2-lipid IV(A) lauroyltransferase